MCMKNKTLSIASLPYPVYIDSVMVAGVDMEDAFDFCDAYASGANFVNGISLNAQQLDTLTDSDKGRELVYKLACEQASGYDEPCEPDDWADGDALASAGWGTDEDYGGGIEHL